jgi:hypothetical protein
MILEIIQFKTEQHLKYLNEGNRRLIVVLSILISVCFGVFVSVYTEYLEDFFVGFFLSYIGIHIIFYLFHWVKSGYESK